MAPVAAVLFVTMASSFFYGDVAQLPGWQIAYKTPLRFLRFASLLCIPLFALPKIYSFITRKKLTTLLQVEQKGELRITPIKHWVFRPFQGIGIGLLFGTKLLTVLQLIAGPTVGSSFLLPEGHFQLGRLLLTTLITLFVSLVLSTLWTLDDLGIRYFNQRDQEVKMIGKYVGTVMPVILGFYGIVSLLGSYSAEQAFFFVFKIAIVLYPPLALFAILHTYFIKNKIELFSKTCLRRGGIWQGA
jgi:hypothetical protein